MTSCVSDLNPGESTWILTRPDDTPETRQEPCAFVAVFILKPVSDEVTVMRALPITAPAGSTTLPPSCPGNSASAALKTKRRQRVGTLLPESVGSFRPYSRGRQEVQGPLPEHHRQSP